MNGIIWDRGEFPQGLQILQITNQTDNFYVVPVNKPNFTFGGEDYGVVGGGAGNDRHVSLL